MSEEAISLQDFANTLNNGANSINSTGNFIERIFGHVIANTTVLASDSLKFYRAGRLIALQEKFYERCAEKGIDPAQTKPMLAKIGIPLLENATLEEDEDIQKKWANMLANAMDPKNTQCIGRNFVTILSDMHSIDVKVLDRAFKDLPHDSHQVNLEKHLFSRQKISLALSLSERQIEISLRNLLRLGCIKQGVIVNNGIRLGNGPLTVYKDTEFFNITELGLEFLKAVN